MSKQSYQSTLNDSFSSDSSHIYENVEPRITPYQKLAQLLKVIKNKKDKDSGLVYVGNNKKQGSSKQNFNEDFTYRNMARDNVTFNTASNNRGSIMNVPYKYALEIIPKFDGDNAMLHEFINRCKEAREMLSTVNEGFLVKLFRNKIIGEARPAITSKTFDTLNEFYSYLKEVFSPGRGFVELTGLLENMYQKDGESVIEYTARVEDLSRRFLEEGISLFGDDNHGILNERVLEKYIKGFNRDIRSALTNKTTFDDVRREAILEEEQLKRDLILRGSVDLQDKTNKSNPSWVRQMLPICQFCSEQGHDASECVEFIFASE